MSKLPGGRRRGKSPSRGAVEITTFANAVRYLLERPDVERMRVLRKAQDLFKLDRMRVLLDAMGNPHEQVRMVHVAGTIGKGSTVAMIASTLEGCEYAVARLTSPHLVDVRERIVINGELIGRTDFTELTKQVAQIADTLDEEPTFFELTTAIAFKYFADQAVDLAVIETGLGGRLDATNVITPEVTAITRISYDHMHILGHTLEAIAREKAGTFKTGVPVISVEQTPEVEAVLRKAAEEVGAPFKVVGKEIEFSSRFGTTEAIGPHTRVCVLTETSQFMHLPVPLPGEHQGMNCGVALAVVDALKASGFECGEIAVHEGLSKSKTPGRMELIWKDPRILADGAHNPESISALVRCVGAHVPYDSMICIFGCCEDKDIPGMLDKIALGGDKVIFTRAKGTPRAADPDELHRTFSERSGKMSQTARNLREALNLAIRAVGRDDLICITGSFFLVGEAKKHFAEIERKRQQQLQQA